MNDELIDRLRRTLHHQAASVRPNPRGYLAAEGDPPRPRRPRPVWPLAVAAAAAVAAAVALIAANLAGGAGGPRVRVGDTISPAGPHPTAPPVSGTPTTVALTPAIRSTAPPETSPSSAPPSSVSGPAVGAVAASFRPATVTFVSPYEGWALGTAACSAGRCLTLAETGDGGLTWRSVPAPTAGDVAGLAPADLSVRFADAADGWVYITSPASASSPSRLWSTHDGGRTWSPVGLAVLTSGTIEGLEAANHLVQMAVLPLGGGSIHIDYSPVAGDHWTDVATGVPSGAGPVPSTELVLQGTAGWMVQNDRTVVGGALTTGSRRWSAWTPPCARANGTAAMAASSSTVLVAVCGEGVWGPAGNLPAGEPSGPLPQWIFRSVDGGVSFQAVRAVPAGFTAAVIAASPAAMTVVLAGSTGGSGAVLASADGGMTWQTAYHASVFTDWKDVGFTTTTQGVAIATGPSGSVLLMTRDGGQHWSPVSF
jgi:photosystem II stability/assembly factor-like uncharacterized protein